MKIGLLKQYALCGVKESISNAVGNSGNVPVETRTGRPLLRKRVYLRFLLPSDNNEKTHSS